MDYTPSDWCTFEKFRSDQNKSLVFLAELSSLVWLYVLAFICRYVMSLASCQPVEQQEAWLEIGYAHLSANQSLTVTVHSVFSGRPITVRPCRLEASEEPPMDHNKSLYSMVAPFPSVFSVRHITYCCMGLVKWSHTAAHYHRLLFSALCSGRPSSRYITGIIKS